MADTVTYLNLGVLEPNPFQPREKIKNEHIAELVDSIKQYGVLEPLVIAQTPAGYQIIAGERRWRAAKAAGLTEVPVIIKVTTPRGMLEMAIVENLQRSDLSPIERAQAFKQLMTDFNLKIRDVASKVGKSEPYVSNTLRLLDLPDAVKDGLAGGLISEGHARALVSLVDDEDALIEAYKMVLKETASVRRTEELVRHTKKDQHKPRERRGESLSAHNQELKELQEKLKLSLNTPPRLNLARTSRQTKVSITLYGSPAQTEADLEKIVKMIEKI